MSPPPCRPDPRRRLRPRMLPESQLPSSGVRDTRKAQDRRDLRFEMLKRVIAAALHRLPRTCVEGDRLLPVEELVAALQQQQVASRIRHALDIERFELDEVFAREHV